MNVLVTGASGFIGSRLVEIIRETNRDWRIIALTSREIEGTIWINHNDFSYTKKSFLDRGVERVDAVLHLGGFVPRSKIDRDSGYKNHSTIGNTIRLIENLPSLPGHFVYLSSSSVYGEDDGREMYCAGKYQEYNEDSMRNPASLYAAAKLFCEAIVREWAEKNYVICHILRPTVIYGYGDQSNMLIPVFVKRAIKGESFSVFCSPDMVRNYLNVDDCCRMILRSLDIKENIGPINLVSGENVTIRDVADTIVKLTGHRISYDVVKNESGFHGRDMAFNGEKCRKYLGQNKVSLEEGLGAIYRRSL